MRIFPLLLAVLVATMTTHPAQAAPAPAPAPLRVWPLGDSITAGKPPPETPDGAYRAPLWRLLKQQGRSVDFVGTRSFAPPDIDPDHDGWNGFRASQLRNSALIWRAQVQPNVVLLDAGVNDLLIDASQGVPQRASAENAARAVLGIVDDLQATQPGLVVIVAALGEVGPQAPPVLTSLVNQIVNDGITVRRAQGRPVSWFDARVPLSETYDGLHPNAVGAERLARGFLAELSPLVACTPRPSVSVTPQRVSPGVLAVTVRSGVPIRSVSFGTGTNVVPPSDLQINGTVATFTVRRAGSSGAYQQPFTVVDDCGPWPSFVGAGS